MTESDWNSSADPQAMLSFLRNHEVSKRKLRLAAVVCCRRLEHLLTDSRSRDAIAVAEGYADDSVSEDVRVAAEQAVRVAIGLALQARQQSDDIPEMYSLAVRVANITVGPEENFGLDAMKALVSGCSLAARDASAALGGRQSLTTEIAALLREIVGNPVPRVVFDDAWRTSDVLAMARGMYETRDFGALPIMADAIQDAGCEEVGILDHCRGPGPHVRGCWVVDLVLNKT